MTTVSLVACAIITGRVNGPLIAQLPNFIIQWGYARPSLIQLDGILGLPHDHPAETANLRPESLQGQLRLDRVAFVRSEGHTSELQQLMCKSFAVFCLHNKKDQSNALRTTNQVS